MLDSIFLASQATAEAATEAATQAAENASSGGLNWVFISAIILVISFFTAHTHGTFYMVFYTIFLMNGYYESALQKEGASLPKTAFSRENA